MATKPKTVTVNRTKVVNGTLYTKGGEYTVDSDTETALKRAGLLGKAAPAAPAKSDEATDDNADSAK